MELNSRSTNPEISQVLGKQLSSGKVVIYAIEPTKNPDFTMLYVCQEVQGARQASDADAEFLGWDSKSVVRALRNSTSAIAKGFKVGDTLPGYNIQIDEDNTPGVKSDGSPQDQKQTPQGVKLFSSENGAPIYRHTLLVKGEATHTLLENQPVQGTNSKAPVMKNIPSQRSTVTK